MIYQTIYNKLEKLIGDVRHLPQHRKSQAPGFMDLSLDRLHSSHSYVVIALSHYYKHPSGDMIADPDMEIRIWYEGYAEALTFQDIFGYRRVYRDNGNLVDTRAKKELNAFLNQWLTNLLNQQHSLKPE